MKQAKHALTLALILVCACLAPAASAQTSGRQTATVVADAPIYLDAAVGLTPLRVAARGTLLKILQQQGDWLQVEFNDPQWGLRVGWVQRSLVQVSSPDLRPMDLSVTPQPLAATAPSRLSDAPPRPTAHLSHRPSSRAWRSGLPMACSP